MRSDCYQCEHRGDLAGSAHSQCTNGKAVVMGAAHGIKNGWFFHPFNFDPVWLDSCDGFSAKQSTPVSDSVSKAA